MKINSTIKSLVAPLEAGRPEVECIDLANSLLANKELVYTKINGDKRKLQIVEVTNIAISKAGDPYLRGATIDRDNNNEQADKTLRLENITLA